MFALNYFFGDCQMSEVIGGENLKKQAWFHGYIPRDEAEQLMKRNGDFLVRETMNSTEQDRYVISSFRNGPVHFKVFPATIVVSEKNVVFNMLARTFILISLLNTVGTFLHTKSKFRYYFVLYQFEGK